MDFRFLAKDPVLSPVLIKHSSMVFWAAASANEANPSFRIVPPIKPRHLVLGAQFDGEK
jgi:hypothetical protein